LLSILYKDNDTFMKYVREVLQRASCVQKTHTMQIGTREGFPNLGRSAL
jgi:ATP-dependent Clp protease adapter protein ClpS